MAKYRIIDHPEVKKGGYYALNIQSGSRKNGDKKTQTYKSGDSVELSPAMAISNASILDITDEQLEKLKSATAEPEPEAKKKEK